MLMDMAVDYLMNTLINTLTVSDDPINILKFYGSDYDLARHGCGLAMSIRSRGGIGTLGISRGR